MPLQEVKKSYEPFVRVKAFVPKMDITELILPLATAIKAKDSSVEKIFK